MKGVPGIIYTTTGHKNLGNLTLQKRISLIGDGFSIFY